MLVPHGEAGPVGLLRLLPQGGAGHHPLPHHLRLGFVLAHALAQPGV
ncbi:MAG: hypothetical protein Q7T97_02710 [Burkholderiaceae bacterium]|nr:hypothetical protein [Burkholderiaceae bacterium]